MKRKLMSLTIPLLLTGNCLSLGCYSDGQGERASITWGGLTWDRTVKPNSVGEYYNKVGIDPDLLRWWDEREDRRGGERAKYELEVILRYLPEENMDRPALLRVYETLWPAVEEKEESDE